MKSIEQIYSLVNFNFFQYKYYFFTIKHNTPVNLLPNLHSMVRIIDYVKTIMLESHIVQCVYCFELDSRGNLHIHGIATSKQKLRYDKLYRSWGVHHNFNQLYPPKFTHHKPPVTSGIEYIDKVAWYMIKMPWGPIIKSLKGIGNNISTFAYANEQNAL